MKTRGDDYVVWDEGAGDLARQFMESRGSDCKGKVAADAPKAVPC